MLHFSVRTSLPSAITNPHSITTLVVDAVPDKQPICTVLEPVKCVPQHPVSIEDPMALAQQHQASFSRPVSSKLSIAHSSAASQLRWRMCRVHLHQTLQVLRVVLRVVFTSSSAPLRHPPPRRPPRRPPVVQPAAMLPRRVALEQQHVRRINRNPHKRAHPCILSF